MFKNDTRNIVAWRLYFNTPTRILKLHQRTEQILVVFFQTALRTMKVVCLLLFFEENFGWFQKIDVNKLSQKRCHSVVSLARLIFRNTTVWHLQNGPNYSVFIGRLMRTRTALPFSSRELWWKICCDFPYLSVCKLCCQIPRKWKGLVIPDCVL